MKKLKQTFSAPLLAEDEAAAGSGAEAADALSKSSNAPEETRQHQVRLS